MALRKPAAPPSGRSGSADHLGAGKGPARLPDGQGKREFSRGGSIETDGFQGAERPPSGRSGSSLPHLLISSPFLVIFFFLLHGVNLAGLVFQWHDRSPWLDSVLHFLGGVWLILVFLALEDAYPASFGLSSRFWMVRVLFLISFVALIGVLWEFFEFGIDYLITVPRHIAISQPSVADTMGDLFFDLAGGAVAVIAARVRK